MSEQVRLAAAGLCVVLAGATLVTAGAAHAATVEPADKGTHWFELDAAG